VRHRDTAHKIQGERRRITKIRASKERSLGDATSVAQEVQAILEALQKEKRRERDIIATLFGGELGQLQQSFGVTCGGVEEKETA
jgi:hypothetical protein